MDQHDAHDHILAISSDDFGDDSYELIEGLEKLTINSVGIDIGSSTSHLVFSRLVLRREGSAFSSRFRVTGQEVLYRSRIMLTPYLFRTLIDTQKYKRFRPTSL
jgi:ethanolamine utilization protein EutA